MFCVCMLGVFLTERGGDIEYCGLHVYIFIPTIVFIRNPPLPHVFIE